MSLVYGSRAVQLNLVNLAPVCPQHYVYPLRSRYHYVYDVVMS